MDVSIIIPSFNTKQLLQRCLRSIIETLKRSAISYEIIVVDNASRDGTVEMLSKQFPQVIKILNKENLGYGKANNKGIKKARGTYILLLNSDIEVLNGSVEQLYAYGRTHPESFAGGKLYNEDGSPQPSCGPMFTLWYVFLMLFFRADRLSITRYSPACTRRVGWVSGACLFGEKRSFCDVGLFDQEIFMYMDEIDFLYRAGKKGYTVFFTPRAKFVHTGAASSANRRAPVTNIFRGLIYFYRKHKTPAELSVLKFMLRTKAAIAIAIGKSLGIRDLAGIYEEALSMVNR